MGTYSSNKGPKCGEHPSVYQRISAYYDWILDNTKDATYCKNQAWDDIGEDTETTSISTESYESTTVVETTLEDHELQSIANCNFEPYYSYKNRFLYFYIIYNHYFYL